MYFSLVLHDHAHRRALNKTKNLQFSAKTKQFRCLWCLIKHHFTNLCRNFGNVMQGSGVYLQEVLTAGPLGRVPTLTIVQSSMLWSISRLTFTSSDRRVRYFTIFHSKGIRTPKNYYD